MTELNIHNWQTTEDLRNIAKQYKNYNIPIEAQYNFVKNSTLDKVAFINYPKKEKLIPDKDLDIIMSHFRVNKSVAQEYIEILGEDRTKEIIKKYKR